MFRSTPRWWMAVAAVWLLGGQAVSTVRADVTISVAPSFVELSATPGGEGSQELTVYNEGSEPFQVTASIIPARGAEGDRSAVEWLKVEPTTFELAPGQERKVKVSIAVPAGLETGGRYAQVAFKTGAKNVSGSGVGVSGQLGVPFLIAVQGGASLTREASVDRLIPVLEPDGRVSFRVQFVNRGNLHLVPRGFVEVSRANGSPAGKLDLPETTPILPGTERLLQVDGSLPLEPETGYGARVTLEYGGGAPAVADAMFAVKAAMAIEKMSVRENPDKGPTLLLSLRNDGEVGLLPRVQVAVRGDDGRVRGNAAPQTPLLWPGQTTDVEVQYPARLPTGEYILVARADYGGSSPAQKETPFKIGNPLPSPNPNWGEGPAWARQQPGPFGMLVPEMGIWTPAVLAVGALGALLFLVVALYLVIRRSGSRQAGRTRATDASDTRPTDGSPPAPGAAVMGTAERAASEAAAQTETSAELETQPNAAISVTGQLETPFPPGAGSKEPTSPSGGSASPASDTRADMAVALVAMGRQAAQEGDRETAYRLMRQGLEMDSRNVDAWVWRAATAESIQESLVCLKTALLLDPENPKAKQGLASLQARIAEDKGER
ncbi:MAG: hypothetical protein ACYC66_11315 [Chloroflexota bacterium]